MHLFFNSSMPRSGSELLQVILHQNPQIYASTTSPLLEYQFGARTNYELPEVQSQDPELMAKAFLTMCRGMAHAYYGAITTRPYVIDKNRGWSHYWEWVHQWQPNPKMICMIRDLRSILASMERIYRKNRFAPIGPDNPRELRNMTVSDRVQYWLNTQPVGLALQRTQDLFERKLADKILFVKYEDLCNNSRETMQRVYAYLGLPYFEHNFNQLQKTVVEIDRFFTPYGSHDIQPVLRAARVNDWVEELDNIQLTSWYQKNFQYEV
jgi:sulfotransferase